MEQKLEKGQVWKWGNYAFVVISVSIDGTEAYCVSLEERAMRMKLEELLEGNFVLDPNFH